MSVHSHLKFATAAAAIACLAGNLSPIFAQSCAEWDIAFGMPGATGEPTANQGQVWEPWIRTFTQHDHGTGPVLYAAGAFTHIGGEPARNVGRSSDGGQTWQSMGTGIIHDSPLNWSRVWTSAGFGDSVYFGGIFMDAGGITASRIARWDGELWHPLGSGLGGNISATLIEAKAMVVWDDGRGDALYVGGRFPEAGGVSVNNIARWDGANWEALGSGITSVSGSGQTVHAMAAFQNKLYVGGSFLRAGGINLRMMATWDGTSWAALPGPQLNTDVYDLVVFDDGTGEALYAGGYFSHANNVVTLNGVGKFDGAEWHPLGNGLQTDTFLHTVQSLAVIDDGTGPALYAGGYFPHKNHLARFDGAAWHPVGGGVALGDPAVITELQAFDNLLHIGGQFNQAGSNPPTTARSMARYGCPEDSCYANCDGSTSEPILTVNDFTCFINEFASAQSLPPAQQIEHYANCDGSTTEPVLTVNDFTCFINEFAQGCP